ncbi:MAG: tyrosine--tRNA ligase [Hyphomonadaceae bacterium]|nr:tyrosine--tRNA ligase [Clostridia bacterium]
MECVFDTLTERGLIAQVTHEEKIKQLLKDEKVTFYIGFDPTADSLHVGHFLQMMVMAHMQRAGHRPIAIIGGGTAMVGDPTGKTDMRQMLTQAEIQHNANCFKKQLSKFIEFGEDKALMIDNAEWLLKLNYVDFLREVGVHFSVNRMLTAECFKSRLEKGLSFIEFNYMLMQSYDFLYLNRHFNCTFELGGDDQWANILGGIELVRRTESKEVYGMTFTLLTNSEGKKMGKTERGAVWLDPEKTSPYEFYQYWRNVPDADVLQCLRLLTFLPMSQLGDMAQWEGQMLNQAKKALAYEVTMLVHGVEQAEKAQHAAEALFGQGGVSGDMPTTELATDAVADGINILDLLLIAGLIPSKAEGRRLVQQGGISIDNKKIESIDVAIDSTWFVDEALMIKKGKKVYHKIQLV